jgi:hypothetical protein
VVLWWVCGCVEPADHREVSVGGDGPERLTMHDGPPSFVWKYMMVNTPLMCLKFALKRPPVPAWAALLQVLGAAHGRALTRR